MPAILSSVVIAAKSATEGPGLVPFIALRETRYRIGMGEFCVTVRKTIPLLVEEKFVYNQKLKIDFRDSGRNFARFP